MTSRPAAPLHTAAALQSTHYCLLLPARSIKLCPALVSVLPYRAVWITPLRCSLFFTSRFEWVILISGCGLEHGSLSHCWRRCGLPVDCAQCVADTCSPTPLPIAHASTNRLSLCSTWQLSLHRAETSSDTPSSVVQSAARLRQLQLCTVTKPQHSSLPRHRAAPSSFASKRAALLPRHEPLERSWFSLYSCRRVRSTPPSTLLDRRICCLATEALTQCRPAAWARMTSAM